MKNQKNLLWFLTIVIMISFSIALVTGSTFASSTWDGSIANDYGGGSGSTEDPYQIANGAQLAYLAQQVNNGNSYNGEFFKLMDDIDLDNISWIPIGYFMGTGGGDGNYIAEGFQGTLDGDDHSIDGLKITTVTKVVDLGLRHPAGLFGMTKPGCRINNLKLVNVDVSTTAENINYLGALIGEGCSITSNCSAVSGSGISINGVASGGGGGLIGQTWSGSKVVNCYTNLPCSNTNGAIGGIVGCNGGNTLIANCYSRSNIVCKDSVDRGALATINYGNMSNCYATGTVNGLSWPICKNTELGSFDVIANSAFYLSNTDGQSAPGYGGITATDDTMKSDDFVNTLNINRSCITGLIPSDIVLFNWIKDTENINAGYPILAAPPANDVTTGVAADAAAAYSEGNGTSDTPYLISNKAQLIQLAVNINSGTVNTTGQYYEVSQDIDMEGGVWTPIGTTESTGFKGNFNFNSKIVSNYSVNSTINVASNYGGLFGFINNGGTVSGYVSPADLAITEAKGLIPASLTAIEGTHTNLLNYLNSIDGMEAKGVSLTLDASGNVNIANDGIISYTDSEVTGNVTVKINKAPGAEQSTVIAVTVPVHENPPEGGFGQALNYDGIDDYTVTPGLGVTVNSFPLTIEALVKADVRDAWSTVNNVISTDEPSKYGHGFGVNVTANDSGLIIEFHNGFRTVPGVNFQAGQWYHIAVVYTSGNFQAYVDGSLVDDFTFEQANPDSVAFVRIGQHNDQIVSNERHHKGAIDEVRVWNVARSQADIQKDMFLTLAGNENGLVGHWRFNDGSGNTAVDSTANGYHATIYNDPARISSGVAVSSVSCEDTAVNGVLPSFDADGDALDYSIVSQGNKGVVTITNTSTGAFSYTPNENENGSDTFIYKVNDGAADSQPCTVTINITAVNDVPSFTKGEDQTVNENSGGQTVADWASNISRGPANESGQNINFIVSNDNNALFLEQPAIGSDGTLSFTPAANVNGSAEVTVRLHDDGGTENGGVDTSESQTFTIRVSPVYTVIASAVTITPIAGSNNTITLTVKKADGTNDSDFDGARNVTISGYTAAPNGSYGSFNGERLTASPNTISVTFTDGVASSNLVLDNPTEQTIGFSINGVMPPQTSSLIFVLDGYTLIYTAGANGSINGTASQTVNHGASGTAVTATPAAGYHFVKWSDDVATAARTDTNVTANISVTATFAVNEYILTYTAGANGSISGTASQTVNHGASGTAVTASPAAGYHFVKWSDNVTTAIRTDSNVTGNINVTAIFAVNEIIPTQYTLTYTAGEHGSINGSTSQTVNQGASGTAVTATPAAGYHFVKWSDNVTTATRTDSNVTANISVTAIFAINEIIPEQYTLTYTAGENGSISGSTSQTVNHGANGTAVTAIPAEGYHFVHWSDGIQTATRMDSNVTANISVTAIFAIDEIITEQYTLTYTAGENGSISGSSSQTVNQGASGTAVTATPAAGYHFVKWSDNVTTATRTDSNVTANISVTAYFAVNEYTLTYNAGEYGSIRGITPQTVSYGMDGSEVEAIADINYYFKNWSDGVKTARRKDLNITGNLNVTAFFAAQKTDLDYDFDSLTIIYAEGDSETHVTRALYLPVKGASGNTSITWLSSHPLTEDVPGIGNTGRVSRPEQDGSDMDVSLTATITDDISGLQLTKQFTVKLIKMSEEDAVQDAARDLTAAKAFQFASGDTWECVTSQFVLLDHLRSTKINWSSNKPDIIQISRLDGKTIGSVSRPQNTDANVILTAEISRGDIKIAKTFLLIVKNQTVSKEDNNVRQTTSREADVQVGGQQGQENTENIDILRTELNNGKKIDTVILDQAKVQNLTDNINPEEDEDRRTITVEITQPETEKADELAVEIPAASLSAMADKNAGLEIKTDEGSISIGHEELQDVAESGTDLFFRIVPVKNQQEQSEVENNMAANFTVVQAANGAPINPLSIPRRIETNYSGSDARVVLPLTGIDIPMDNRQAFLDSMRIFIEHSDGSTELLSGIFLYQNGQPTEIEFIIDRFSRFQLLSFYRAPLVDDDDNDDDSDGSSSDSSTTPSEDSNVIILVNGKAERAGIASTATEGGYSVNKISVDPEKLEQKLESEGNNAVVTIPFANKADTAIGEVNGQMVKIMETCQDVLELKTENAVYTLPARQINIDAIAKRLGPNTSLEDIIIQINISRPLAETIKIVEDAARIGDFSIVVPALDFTVKYNYENKSVELPGYNEYVERSVAVPEGVDLDKITTGVVVEKDGKVRHVPTRVVQIDGKYYAKINSLTDSTYTIIWHPLVFKDAERHWAKEAINDMASRMVVNGTGDEIFEPDSNITRAEFTAIIVRALGLKAETGTSPFTDVKASDNFSGFIKTAYEYKIIFGYNCDRFGPMDKITREQAISMIARAMSISGLEVNFTSSEVKRLVAGLGDVSKCTEYAKNSIAACTKSGILTGRANNLLAPRDKLTRGEAAVIVRRLLQKSDLI